MDYSLTVITLPFLVFVGCSNPVEADDGQVQATLVNNQVCLQNFSSRSIRYFMVEYHTLGKIDWVRNCNSGSVLESYRQICSPVTTIQGYTSAPDTIVVEWWTCRDGRLGPLHHIHVQVR